MDKRILVITGMFFPSPSANGLCLDAILKELHNHSYFAEVVSFSNIDNTLVYNYCRVHNINTNNIIRRSKNPFLNVLNFIKIFVSYPLHKKADLKKVFSCAKCILESNDISFILIVQKPASSSYIGMMLKKHWKTVPCYLYEMDSLTDNGSNFVGWKRMFKGRNRHLERRIFQKFDFIMYLKSHYDYYQRRAYKTYSNKMVCIDTPLLDKTLFEMAQTTKNADGKSVRFMYSGVLTMASRSPESFIDFLEHLNKIIRSKCVFYVRGNAVDYIKKRSYNNNVQIIVNDYIPRDKLDLEICSTDFLVSIGESFNSRAFSFPSKIIYYMSFGKPIVHFAYDKNDLCIDYLTKYPLSLILFNKDGPEINAKRFTEFFDRIRFEKIDFNLIERHFYMNSPSYTVDILLSKNKE